VRAAYVEQFGPADAIRYGAVPAPQPGPQEVLVTVEATTANHVDTFIRSGALGTRIGFPFIVGRDLVGTVASVGAAASGFAAGDRVWCNSLGYGGRQGAAAELAAVPADRLYHLPDRVPIEAVTVLHPTATAYLGLMVHGELRPGETVVVVGAAGNVGSAAITIASHAGARIVAIAHARDLAYCASLGADTVLDAASPSFADRLASATGDGVDVYLDTAGANDLPTAVSLLRMRGRIVVLAGLRTRANLALGDLYVKDGSIRGFAITNATVGELAEAADAVNQLLIAGHLRSRRIHTLPLADTAEAHRMLESGELHGARVLLQTP